MKITDNIKSELVAPPSERIYTREPMLLLT